MMDQPDVLGESSRDDRQASPEEVVGASGAPLSQDSWDTETATTPAFRSSVVPVSAIDTNPRQPRTVFDEEALAELRTSIRSIGLLQPLVVRTRGNDPVDERYELVAGERRLRCVRELGWDTVPVMIRETSDRDLLRDALLENLHRADLNPLEEAAAYEQLLGDFGCTHEELASRVGRSRPQITNTLRLLRLPVGVQRRVAAGVLSQGHARALLTLPDEQSMEALALRIVAEGLSVRSVEEIVSLGERAGRPTPRRRPVARSSEGYEETADLLAERLDTRVQVRRSKGRGRLTIDFADRDDLSRILALLGGTGTQDTPV